MCAQSTLSVHPQQVTPTRVLLSAAPAPVARSVARLMESYNYSVN